MIRAARASDAEAIRELWNEMIRDTVFTFTTVEKTTAGVSAMIAERQGASFVAETGGRFAGFVSFGPFRSGPGYAHTVEHTVLLHSGSRGGGVGRALMARAEAAALALGHHVMVAAISASNPGAVAFHGRLGFIEVARMPEVGRKNGQWLDLVLMQKTL
ncbi:N-acetyltransferase family protein [Sulfitobacter sp. LCG007]